MFKFGKRSIANREGVHPDLIRVSDRAIEITRVDFGIPEHGGLRTTEEQQKLYADKLSGADGIRNKSYHQSGNALDFYAYVDGAASWEPEHLAMIAAAFYQSAIELGVRIEWGGLWKKGMWAKRGDMPHIQLME